MSDVRLNPDNYVNFVLKADTKKSLTLLQEPEGWDEDELELERNKDYHGIFTKITNVLTFYGEEKDYILSAYIIGGINTDLRLTKYITRDIENEDGIKEVKFFNRYSALADYKTMVIKDNGLEINFNSNDLAELIKSHEDDAFEIERIDSIDGVELEPVNFDYIAIEGRDISNSGEQKIDLTEYQEVGGRKYQNIVIGDTGFVVCRTEIVSQGSERHSPVNLRGEFLEANPTSGIATDAMFIIDDVVDSGTLNIDFNFYFEFAINTTNPFTTGNIYCDLVRYKWNGTGYNEVSVENILIKSAHNDTGKLFTYAGNRKFIDLDYDEGLMFRWKKNDGDGKSNIRFFIFSINFTTVEFYESSPAIRYMFVHDVYERLLYILTGEKNRFYSKFFGRTELGYIQDGLDEKNNLGGGLIGMISGYWVRQFDPLSEKYKSLQISLKDLNESNKAVFNVGFGIEEVDFKERLRVEEQKYFYREKTVVKLPNQITNVKRSVDKSLFFSGTELGYAYGATEENEVGLDEPNTKTTTVTPIRKSDLKYSYTSKVRADEYKFEKLRRKPQSLYPDNETTEDEDNWFLDIVRDESIIPIKFRQAKWQDRLQKEPSGIHSPNTFRSMIFTPFRLLLRHGWIIRSGMEVYLNKFIKYATSVANSKLSMLFIGETEEFVENTDILVSKLDRARFLPEIVEFEHSIDEDLMDLILGTTKILVNGSYENVPNFYFKFEWINENEEIERGYLINCKPKGNGKFTMLKANENIIYNG